MPTGIKLALAHQATLFRTMLKEYLSGYNNIRVPVQVSNVSDLFVRLESSSVDVLVLDTGITKKFPGDILELIHTKYTEMKVIILSEHTEPQIISDFLGLGIYGYISSAEEPEELRNAIMAAAANRIYRNKLFTEALYWNRQKNTITGGIGPIATLNQREQRILQLLWEEKNNKEIAAELFIGVRSIEKIRHDMKDKLGIKSTVGLFKYGIEKGIIEISSKELMKLNNA